MMAMTREQLNLKRRCKRASDLVARTQDHRDDVIEAFLAGEATLGALEAAHEAYCTAVDVWGHLFERSGEAAKNANRLAEDAAELRRKPVKRAKNVIDFRSRVAADVRGDSQRPL